MRFLIDQTAGVAAAQTPPAAPPSGAPGGGGMGMGMGMRGPMNLEAMTARQDMMFGRMDTNQDGFLTLVQRDLDGPGFVYLNVGNCSNETLYDIVRRDWLIVIGHLTDSTSVVEVRP